ncbi:glycosyltransferase family 4 protein [Candidatus Gracilibacteria bacterium]|nr:glycosyltransferase family 4 protein [Candidatus Gracilibacteria bacterium]
MHILFILDYFTPHRGGSETVFENIISRLIKKGHKISVLTSHFDKKLKNIEKHNNLTIYRTGKNRIRFMISGLFLGIKLLRKNKDIKIIHTSTYGGAIPASILGLLFKKKVILTIHEIFGKLRIFYKGKFWGFFYRLFENLIFQFPYSIYHCVSIYTLNSLRISYKIPDNKLKMIHNGVDMDFWDINKIDESKIKDLKEKYGLKNSIVLLYYGHAGKSKGIDYLVKAIPEILKINPKIKLIFNLINSKRKNHIKQEIIKLQKRNPDKIILFEGFEMEELRNLIACCDMVIAPSISEGFGSVHTESVAMGKTLLTTNIASIPEVVRGKVKFVNPRSSNEIIKGVKNILEGKIESITTKAFSRDNTVTKIEKLYKNLSD